MATVKQIEANRINAQRSTGPKSDEGKARSRLNAVTHGMAANLPEALEKFDDLSIELERRKVTWRKELQPVGEIQETLFNQVVVESIRVERCQETFVALCRQHGNRARVRWEEDRRSEAEELAAQLTRSPSVVAAKLEITPHGCDLKIKLWDGLASSLKKNRVWTGPQHTLALDLLGVHPTLRDAETPIDPDGTDPYETRVAVIEREVIRLTKVREKTLGLDLDEREMAEQTLGAEFTRPVQRLDRYERNALRRQQWAWRKLIESKSQACKELSPTSAPFTVKPTVPPGPEIEIGLPSSVPPVSQPEASCYQEVTARCSPLLLANAHRASRPNRLNRRQRRKLAALDRRS